MSQPVRIAVSNQKGGVGKTTTAINVAGALNQRGQDVLLVDLDPQGAATEGLGLAAAYDAQPPSLYDVLTDPEQRDEILALVEEHAEMDVIPSNVDMTAAEPELTVDRRGSEKLGPALEHVEDGYDYVIIDCPPYLGYLADNGLTAAKNVLVPALAESTSKRALELLVDHIESLEYDTDLSIEEIGLVANRVEETNEATEMVEWFGQAFPDIPVWEIRKRVALQRAFSNGSSIFEYQPECDMADRYLDIASTLEAELGEASASEVEA